MVKSKSIDVPGKGLMIISRNSVVKTASLRGREQPKASQPKDELTRTKDYVPAGLDNKLFEKMLEDAKNTIITPGISLRAEMLYGAGPCYGIPEDNGSLRTVYDRNVSTALRKMDFAKALMCTAKDLWGLGSAYYQISLNAAGTRIMAITSHFTRSRNVRLGWRNERGMITEAFVNADFGRAYEDESRTIRMPVIDTTYDSAQWLRDYVASGKSARHFILPVQYISLGAENYYPMPDWDSARATKWISIAKKVAEVKAHFMENQINMKYQFEVHNDYWPMRFGKTQWDAWSDEEKLGQMEEETTRIDEFFKGIEGGNILMTGYKVLKDALGNEQLQSLIKITEFKQYFVDGVHIEDSHEASQHLLFALGLHTSVFGTGAKGAGLGNSGSENRVSYEQRKANLHFWQQQLLSPLYLTDDFNGWGSYEYWIKSQPTITTLDEVAPEDRSPVTEEAE